MDAKRLATLPGLLFFLLFFPFFSNGASVAEDNRTDGYRELKERVAGHVHFLTIHAALVDTKGLVIPPFFTVALVKELANVVYMDGTACLRDFWKNHQEVLLNDEVACREFIFLLIALYHNLTCTRTSSLRGIPWLSLAALYLRLNAIPLGKLFDILDECYTYYQSILSDFGHSTKPNQSLGEWLVEYWWLPTLMIGMGTATLVRWMRARKAKKTIQII